MGTPHARLLFVAAVCVVLTLGCGRAGKDYKTLPYDDTVTERFTSSSEWRDARKFETPGAWRLPLGNASPGDVVRFSFFADPTIRETYSLDIAVNGETMASHTTTPLTIAWADMRVALPSGTPANSRCEVLIDAPSYFWISSAEVASPGASTPNILMVMIDTLRQDRLGCYGYHRDTSPNIDALARDGVVFTGMTPQSSWTRPSVASLLTGTYPARHGAQDRSHVMRSGLPSLADALELAGYTTAGFMSNVNCIPYWGFGHDFDRFVDVDSSAIENYDDAKVVDKALDAIAFAAGSPWFVYVHCMGPHDPYAAPAPYGGTYADPADDPESMTAMGDRYDEEIAYTDAQVGRLIDALKASGQYDNTCIVVLSDHGEEFGEHGGTGHGKTLYEEQLRVPFIVKQPHNANAGARHNNTLEVVDIAPTIVEAVSAPAEPRFDGRSFLSLLEAEALPRRFAYASLYLENTAARTVKSRTIKFLDNIVDDAQRWFDLARDPAEQAAIAETPEEADEMLAAMHKRSTRGAHGLHILITGRLDSDHKVSGVIESLALGRAHLQFGSRLGKLAQEDGRLHFEVAFSTEGIGLETLQDWYDETEETPAAHLHVPILADATAQLTMQLNDAIVPEDRVALGTQMKPGHLDQFQLSPLDWVADSSEFQPAVLPDRFGVYIWYVPNPDTIADADLDPAMLEALRNLGYVR